ncbi:PIN domain-containing protein [Nocardia sp. NBC_01499]|uniref:type II toxin-antitoxin system VapC family toxin n=1 Tax=Nocardia sp. NBC_01499 TaxID=2903597 RepID=UPI003869DAC6
MAVTTTVLDTGPLVALMDRSDNRHAECAQFFATLRGRLLLPASVMIEACWLLEERPDIEAAFLDRVEEDVFELVSFTKPDVGRIAELVRQYADFPLGSVDASVIAVAERFDTDRVATLDRKHFGVVRPAHVRAFALLP